MPPVVITGRTKLLGVLADPVAQARSPGMANALLQEKRFFGEYVLVPLAWVVSPKAFTASTIAGLALTPATFPSHVTRRIRRLA